MNARSWQLYADKRGAGLAAHRLNRALEKAKVSLKDPVFPDFQHWNEHEVGRRLSRVCREIMYPALEVDDQYGACDSEPRFVASQALINFIKQHYRIDTYTQLGEYI